MKRILRPVGRVLLTVLSLGSLLLLHTPTATATPVITYANCESGASQYLCYVYYTNTVGTVFVTWDFYQGSSHHFSKDGAYVFANCQRLRWYTIYVNVTDVTGTAQTSGTFECNPYAWP